MIEPDGEGSIHGSARVGGAEMQPMIGLIHIVEDVIDSCFEVEGEGTLLAVLGGERIVARQSPKLVALAVAVQLVVAFGGGTSVNACSPCVLVLQGVVPRHITIPLVVCHTVDDHAL